MVEICHPKSLNACWLIVHERWSAYCSWEVAQQLRHTIRLSIGSLPVWIIFLSFLFSSLSKSKQGFIGQELKNITKYWFQNHSKVNLVHQWEYTVIVHWWRAQLQYLVFFEWCPFSLSVATCKKMFDMYYR